MNGRDGSVYFVPRQPTTWPGTPAWCYSFPTSPHSQDRDAFSARFAKQNLLQGCRAVEFPRKPFVLEIETKTRAPWRRIGETHTAEYRGCQGLQSHLFLSTDSLRHRCQAEHTLTYSHWHKSLHLWAEFSGH